MNKVMVKYDGRLIPKEGFRAFIYDADGQAKLVNSWEEFESHIHLGTWFASKSDIKEKQKTRKKGD